MRGRLKCILQHQNAGKREALVLGAEAARHELLVFVDSDSFLDPFAIRNLVQPFRDPKVGGCAGRTDVANTFTNYLTRMQAVRYYIAFRVMKAAEACFDTVSCLSGPISCYRKEIVLEYKDAWLGQKFLGQKATFGDDRSMTNFILRKHRTVYQDTAICSTIVPNSNRVFLKQQMRWKRSWLRESLIAAGFMWKKEPFAALGFYMGLIVPIAAPVVVLYNLVYVPIVHRIFPVTFLVGLLMMSLLMSAAQLFLRKSSTWLYGMLFCLYYEVVLLWQMPVAWVTFWKSTWGTRMTPKDILAAKRHKKKGQTADAEGTGSSPDVGEGLQTEGTAGREDSEWEVAGKNPGGNLQEMPTPKKGFSVITAGGSFYMEDDKLLTPDTGMEFWKTEAAAIAAVAAVGVAAAPANVAAAPETAATGMAASAAIASVTAACAAAGMPIQKKQAQAPGSEEYWNMAEQVIHDMTVEISQIVTRSVREIFSAALVNETAQTITADVVSQLKQEMGKEIKADLMNEIRTEIRTEIRAEMLAELKEEIKTETLAELLKKRNG